MAQASGLVLRRALTQKLVVSAALGTIVLATTVLTALLLYATSVTDDGIRRSLATAPPDQVSSRITAQVTPENHDVFDSRVRSVAQQAYSGISIRVIETARSQSYSLPGQETRGEQAELTTFAMYDGIQDRADLTVGRWPQSTQPDSAAVEAAFPSATAEDARLTTGKTYMIVNRIDHKPLRVTVTGLYRPKDAQDPFWSADPLAAAGVQRLSYTTFGPLIVDRATFLSRFGGELTAVWQVLPDLAGISSSEVGALRSTGEILESELDANQAGGQVTTSTGVSELAAQLDSAALVARSTMLIPVLQLAVLAAYALLLTARLISDHRRPELALLRARGADAGQLAALSLREGLLLAAPAAVLAPLLASPILHLVNTSPTVRAAGLTVDSSLKLSSWMVAATAAGLCAIALTVPTLRDVSKTYVETQQARGRGERRSLAQQAGADVAILAIAVLGFWQLRRYGSPVTATVTQAEVGGLGIDPLLVAGPAIGLVAGGLLALRLVPILSGGAERLTSRGPGLASALGAWQVARRPLRYAGPALLLVMAMAVGVLSLTASSTWRKSQNDQADLAAGADLRVMGKTGTSALTVLGQGGRLAALPGVTAITPAYRLAGAVGARSVDILALDADKLADIVTLRADLQPDVVADFDRSGDGRGGLTEAAKLLGGARPPLVAMPLPGEPTAVGLEMRAAPSRGSYDGRHAVLVDALITDAFGVTYSVRAGNVDGDGTSHALSVDLRELAGSNGRLAYPLELQGLRLTYSAAADGNIEPMSVTVDRITAKAADGDEQSLGDVRGKWLRAPGLAPTTDGRSLVKAEIRMVDPTARVAAPTGFGTNSMATYLLIGAASERMEVTAGGVQTGFGPNRSGNPKPVRALVTPALLDNVEPAGTGGSNNRLGGSITLTLNGRQLPVQVAGVIGALPGTAAGRQGILVDTRTLSAARLVAAGEIYPVSDWWIATNDRGAGPAATALKSNPNLADSFVDWQALRSAKRDDPLGSGLQGALFLGFLAAFAFAAIGFAVNAAVSARERMTEFALMRALGISSRQVFGLLGVEQTFLVTLGVLGGIALGVAVSRLVIPHIVLTAQATAVSPPVILSTPWLWIAVLAVAVMAALGAIVGVLAASLRRGGLGATLRIGEDR